MSSVLTIPVTDIKAGDQLIDAGRVYWTALSDAKWSPQWADGELVGVEVEYADLNAHNPAAAAGGYGQRVWDRLDDDGNPMTITIHRSES